MSLLGSFPRRVLALASAVSLGTLMVATAAPASAAVGSTCSTGALGAVTVTLADSDDAWLYVDSGNANAVSLYSDQLGLGMDCGSTTADAESIAVTGTTGNETLVLDESFGGPLEPGATPEAGIGAVSEIEVNVDLGDGNDDFQYFGTSGNDTAATSSSGLNTSGDSDADVTLANTEQLYLSGSAGGDTLTATSAPTGVTFSFLGGGDDGDTLTGGSLAEVYNGGAGDDTISASSGNDTISGGPGDDTIQAGTGTDTYTTETGYIDEPATQGMNSRMGQAANVNDGYGDSDSPYAFEVIQGTSFNDVIRGSSDAETIYGGDGNDNIDGGAGNDVILGEDGTDRLTGNYGNDTLNGGLLDDRLIPRSGNDTVIGGSGTDVLDFTNASARVVVDLNLGTATGTTEGTDSVASAEDVWGTSYADRITGSGAANRFEGRNGNDNLAGLAGNDTLIGGGGDDTMTGGADNDTCTGGSGTGDSAASCETTTGVP